MILYRVRIIIRLATLSGVPRPQVNHQPPLFFASSSFRFSSISACFAFLELRLMPWMQPPTWYAHVTATPATIMIARTTMMMIDHA